ncbi:MAG: hypothetical protein ACI9T9_001279 [Oleiphilaceae bacterium]|jgi:hypothetical protein
MKEIEKIKLISQASVLLGQLELLSTAKSIPVLRQLTGIIGRLAGDDNAGDVKNKKMKLIETSTNAIGDVYELFMSNSGKSFKTVVHNVARTNRAKTLTLPADVTERKHRYMEAALNSSLRIPFTF